MIDQNDNGPIIPLEPETVAIFQDVAERYGVGIGQLIGIMLNVVAVKMLKDTEGQVIEMMQGKLKH